MKIGNNSITTLALGVALMLGATGCSVFKPVSNKDGSGKGLQGWVESEKNDVAKDMAKGEKTVMSDSEKAMTKADEKLHKIADGQMDDALTGDWAIETVLGKKAVGETAPFIKFVPGENRIYGNNGCNVINGQ
ncbi:MAG: META domain-containing protein [Muribaculaceae bacterium]|nr:META domain-containing protein [Muribaculaceae bacterium]